MRSNARGVATALGALAAVLLVTSPAESATHRVGGKKGFATIGEAVTAASDGDKIVIAKGRYIETVTVVAKSGLVFKARRGVEWMPEVWGDTCLELSQGADRAQVQGITFRTTGTAIALGAVNGVSVVKCRFRGVEWAVDGAGDDFTAQKCDVRHCGNGLRVVGNDVTLERCTFVAMARDGVDITGDDARVTRTTIRLAMDSSNLRIIGNGALVEKCRVRVSTSHGIEIIGDGARVIRNDISQPDDDGIHVVGAGALVEKNDVRSSGDDGIYVRGAAFTVTRNRVSDVNDATASIRVDNDDLPGVATLSKNVVEENAQSGFRISGTGVRSTDNIARDCGDDGFEIDGADHVLEGDAVFGSNRSTFRIRAAGSRLIGCTAVEGVEDGFWITSTGVTLERCRATQCGANGVQVSGLDVTVEMTGCTLRDNRQDVGVSGEATITDGGGNRFETGGFDVPAFN